MPRCLRIGGDNQMNSITTRHANTEETVNRIMNVPKIKSPGRFRHYFAGISWLSKTEPGIMNKYLAGLFRTSALRNSGCERAVAATGAGPREEEIVILCRKGCPEGEHRTRSIPGIIP
jgi:hypothetical protein